MELLIQRMRTRVTSDSVRAETAVVFVGACRIRTATGGIGVETFNVVDTVVRWETGQFARLVVSSRGNIRGVLTDAALVDPTRDGVVRTRRVAALVQHSRLFHVHV